MKDVRHPRPNSTEVRGGYTKETMIGVSPRKGGHNPAESQITTRPGRPAPMRPASSPDRTSSPEKKD